MSRAKLSVVSDGGAEADLEAALDAARDDARLRERALTLAVNHLGKRSTYTTNAEKITALADAFYRFLKGDE